MSSLMVFMLATGIDAMRSPAAAGADEHNLLDWMDGRPAFSMRPAVMWDGDATAGRWRRVGLLSEEAIPASAADLRGTCNVVLPGIPGRVRSVDSHLVRYADDKATAAFLSLTVQFETTCEMLEQGGVSAEAIASLPLVAMAAQSVAGLAGAFAHRFDMPVPGDPPFVPRLGAAWVPREPGATARPAIRPAPPGPPGAPRRPGAPDPGGHDAPSL